MEERSVPLEKDSFKETHYSNLSSNVQGDNIN